MIPGVLLAFYKDYTGLMGHLEKILCLTQILFSKCHTMPVIVTDGEGGKYGVTDVEDSKCANEAMTYT